MSKFINQYIFNGIIARYVQPHGSNRCELHLVPLSKRELVVEPRLTLDDRPEICGLPTKFKPIMADSANSLVQIKLLQDNTGGGFSSGVSMTESGTMEAFEYVSQRVIESADETVVETLLSDTGGRFRCIHRLRYVAGESGLRSSTEFINESSSVLSLELLTSFALNGLTPFASGNATPHLVFHRFRSWWSLEGRTDSASLESLHLERSWGGFALFSERFGQLGTMPVRRWFPCAAVEDKTAGVVWAAQIAWAGSWQMELLRKGDRVTLCGGLADREFGHWVKRLEPHASFISPEAFLTVVDGTLDDAMQALVSLQRTSVDANAPAVERELPICFNEWCTSWGNPSHESILGIATRLQGYGVRYIVIDDGWAVRPPEALIQSNGDWVVNLEKFPGNLKYTCDALREMGYIPGIWFEFEVINPGAEAWNQTAHMLQRDGRPLQVGSRRFWDFNDPWVHEYLADKVIRFLRDNGIGYLKVDYNDNIGMGCDHSDSCGEGLRRHVEGVQKFFRILRREIPDLVIENCSSGGHRLEPSMQALASLGSFSDAHEPVIIPILARNLNRFVLPQQLLIWAVLHLADDEARLIYSLAATFLGRMCLSGDIHDLEDWQMNLLKKANNLYREAASVIQRGRPLFFGTVDNSYVDPQGWQAVVRINGDKALIVIHGFNLAAAMEQRIELPFANARCIDSLSSSSTVALIRNNQFFFTLPAGCNGGVWLVTAIN